MTILIDSHVFIWLLYRSERLGADAKQLLEQADAVYVSVVSQWELAIKYGKGKLAYAPKELMRGMQELGLEQLAIQYDHILRLAQIKLEHGDPFDRLLLAQSEAEGHMFLTADRLLLDSPHKTYDAQKPQPLEDVTDIKTAKEREDELSYPFDELAE